MHLELTTRCTLLCPACPRTTVAEKLGSFPKADLDIGWLISFLDCPEGQKINKFNLEGNHGDPIYYPHLLRFISTFRDKQFTIVTNGSYRSESFWHELGQLLLPTDQVIFSIDGLEHNNHLYRKNSDWGSIMLGLKILSTYDAQLVWKTILFNYNYQEIDTIKDLAESYGAKFASVKTNRFGDETLRPPTELVDTQREYSDQLRTVTHIVPQCHNARLEYISADGYYWPCCWVSSAFTLYKSELWKDRSNWSIQNRTLDELRAYKHAWLEKTLNQSIPVDTVCKMMCKPGNTFWDGYT